MNDSSVHDNQKPPEPIPVVNIASLSGKGAKFFVTAKSEDKTLTMFLDSAADVSLIPAKLAEGMKQIKLKLPFKVSGFSSSVREVLITHQVELNLNFHPGQVKLRFYVSDIDNMILGTDNLRNKRLNLSLITGQNLFRVGQHLIRTKDTHTASKKEYKRRKGLGALTYRRELHHYTSTTAWMRSTVNVVLPPKTFTVVTAYIDSSKPIDDEHSLLSLFDSYHQPKEGTIIVPSITYEEKPDRYILPIENPTDKEIVICKNFIFGEVVTHPSNSERNDVEVFSIAEIMLEVKRREEEEEERRKWQTPNEDAANWQATNQKTTNRSQDFPRNEASTSTVDSAHGASCSDGESQSRYTPAFSDFNVSSASTKPKKNTEKSEGEFEKQESPQLFSNLHSRNKVDDDTLHKARRDGIIFDMEIEQEPLDCDDYIEMIDDVDIDQERAKSKDCPFWPDREAFLSEFNFKDLEGGTKSEVEDLLWDFKHIFYNEKTPEQFKPGIKCKPIKIETLPGAIPKKEKCRRISDKKLKYLKEHVEALTRMGVLEELKDATKCHCSPVHIVLESRYVASKGTTVEKSRFTADLRALNQVLPDSSYPLPDNEHFRQMCAEKGVKYWSNFDASQFFFQYKVDPESARKYLGIYALGRVFVMLSLAMGLKIAPQIVQFLTERMFRCHKNVKTFIDDLTTFSKTLMGHLRVDLPKTFAICSYYRILLKPSKADLVRHETRILGHSISESTMSLSSEKLEKIRSLTFPVDKADLISKLAFLQYFQRLAPKLSELTAPLRKLALPHVRFQPTEQHKRAFQQAIEHLLDEKVAVIRMPSTDLRDTVILFTDASSSSLSCLLCQMLLPLDAQQSGVTTRQLSIIGSWSSVLKPSWTNFPIWLLELLAFSLTVHKFSWLLGGRVFWVVTDSKVVTQWASLSKVPKDIARKILALQGYQYRVLFVESRLNPADTFSRLDTDKQTESDHPRFLKNRIFNAKGEVVPFERLFSERKAKEAEMFFNRHRNQQLSNATDNYADIVKEDEDDMEEEENNPFLRPQHTLEIEQNSHLSVPDEDEVSLLEPEPISEVFATIAALEIDDEDLRHGRAEEEEEGEVDENTLKNMSMPIFEKEELARIHELQRDMDLYQCRDILMDNYPQKPTKLSALACRWQVQKFIRHRSLFCWSPQSVLFRLWTYPHQPAKLLICVGQEQMKKLVEDVHTYKPDGANQLCHLGKRKTMKALSSTYYAFNLRQIVHEVVSTCGNCRLNNHVRTNPEDQGNQIRTEPNSMGVIDFWGPINGFGLTTTGQPQFVMVYIDSHSRYMISYVSRTTGDNDVFRALQKVRHCICGFPSRIQADNALLSKNSKARKFLEAHGVRIHHGAPYVSRNQAMAERAINSLARTTAKLHSDQPNTNLTCLVEEATFILNSSPSDGLPADLTPKSVHFTRPPSTFMHDGTELEVGKAPQTIRESIKTSQAASRRVLQHNVAQALKREEKTSPANYSRRLKVGDLVLKKKTTFPTHSPKKLAFKVVIQAYKVIARLATNTFRVQSIVDNSLEIQPGDHLIRLTNMSEEQVLKLVRSMEKTSQVNTAVTDRAQTRAMKRAETRATSNALWKRQMFVDEKDKTLTTPDLREFQVLAT